MTRRSTNPRRRNDEKVDLMAVVFKMVLESELNGLGSVWEVVKDGSCADVLLVRLFAF